MEVQKNKTMTKQFDEQKTKKEILIVMMTASS